ncbi:protein-tyrosine phosphatase family protein [Streptomyces sp. NPDC047461]|uniref:phosphatase domain-containing protein n=1 Tax=Streptomyces sp. NPDC047461 TaxID=3155619 RepID=UPI00340260FD
MRRLLDIVAKSSGPVFVHCGAGVGRTGTMAAAYLVQTGAESSGAAVRRNLAVGPPSIEQIHYGLNLSRKEAAQPPLPVVAVSRPVDAPRRIASWFWCAGVVLNHCLNRLAPQQHVTTAGSPPPLPWRPR